MDMGRIVPITITMKGVVKVSNPGKTYDEIMAALNKIEQKRIRQLSRIRRLKVMLAEIAAEVESDA